MPSTRITNQHILNELNKLRTEELKPLRLILTGNGEPQKGVCYKLEQVTDRLDNHIKYANGKNKKILGVPAEVRSEAIKWFIRIGNVLSWLFLAWLVNWFAEHGVELTEILKSIPK